MEEFFYLVLIIIWLVVSYFQRQKKAREKAAKPQPYLEKDPSAAPSKEVDMEELLEEFFGGGKKKSSQGEQQEASDFQEVEERESGRGEPSRRERQPAYESWESQAQRNYNDAKEDRHEEPLSEGYEEFKGAGGVGSDFEFSTEGKVETIEDLIRTHMEQDAREQAMAEEKYESEKGRERAEFDLQTAVIFSEILNKKYT
ncbi:MAG: OadG family protein [Bacteroidales bacterium]